MAGLQEEAELAAVAEVKKQAVYEDEKHVVHSDDKRSSIEHSGHYDNDHMNDGIHDGLRFPTDEERATLRRVADKIPINAYLIAFVELAERFSFYGSSVVFTNFIQQGLPRGSHTGAGGNDFQSGALGMGQQASTGLTTFYQFWAYVVPLLGGYIADAHLGRYNTIVIAVVIALVGHVLLIIAAVPGVIEHSQGSSAAFILGMIVTGFGTGLFKANISPLVAEQYRRTKLFVQTEKSGELVIVDPVLTISRVYMYFYLFINIGALVGQIGMTYSEKFVGFWLAYTLPTVVFLICPIILWLGRNKYHRSPPTGSVLASSFRLFRYAAKGRWSANPVKAYKQLTADDFWENAKPSRQGANKPAWMTFDDQWVEEVRRGLKACSVFCWYPLWWLTYNQCNNNLVSQAATMSTHGLPNDVLSNLDPFALILIIPICDLLIYPALRRAHINFSAIKKITAGFAVGALSMLAAAVTQHYIYQTSPCGYGAGECEDADGHAIVSPLNVWIQTPSYVLIALSEIFASITGLEYAFTKAPHNMRSLVMAVFFFMSAISSALGEAFVSLSTDPLLIWNYGAMGVLSGLGAVCFWFMYRRLDADEDRLNNLAEGHVGKDIDHTS